MDKTETGKTDSSLSDKRIINMENIQATKKHKDKKHTKRET